MTCSLLAGARSWVYDGPARQDHHGWVMAVSVVGAVILYQHAMNWYGRAESRDDSVTGAVHGGRADLGSVHGGAGCQPASRLAAWNLGAGIVATTGAGTSKAADALTYLTQDFDLTAGGAPAAVQGTWRWPGERREAVRPRRPDPPMHGWLGGQRLPRGLQVLRMSCNESRGAGEPVSCATPQP
jgi:hypothetical protein